MPERGVPEGTQYLAHADLTLRNATSKKGTMGGAKQRMRPERYYQEPVTEIITKENKYQDGFAHKEESCRIVVPKERARPPSRDSHRQNE